MKRIQTRLAKLEQSTPERPTTPPRELTDNEKQFLADTRELSDKIHAGTATIAEHCDYLAHLTTSANSPFNLRKRPA